MSRRPCLAISSARTMGNSDCGQNHRTQLRPGIVFPVAIVTKFSLLTLLGCFNPSVQPEHLRALWYSFFAFSERAALGVGRGCCQTFSYILFSLFNRPRARLAALVRNYLEVYWPCAGGLSTVNAIGTELSDPINSGLTRCRIIAVLNNR